MKQGVEHKAVKVRTSDGLDLTFWWWDQQKVRDKLLIVSPGFAQHHGTNIMRHIARMFWDGRDVLGVDFRGMAGNPGRYGFGHREHLDLAEAFRWAKKMRYKRVELIGFSMGAYIGLRALATDPGPVKRFYFVSGPTRIHEIVSTGGLILQPLAMLMHPIRIKTRVWAGSQFLFRWDWPLRAMPRGEALAAEVKVPTHYLIGEADRLVLPKLTEAVYQAARKPKTLTVFKNGQHAEYLAVTRPEEILGWMREHGFRG